VLGERDGEVQTVTFDRSREVDGRFTLYTALCSVGDCHIVGNGDQVAAVARALESGGSFEDTLRTQAVEQDPPIWTPRITALLRGESVRMSKIGLLGHVFFEAAPLAPGEGLCLHTYRGDADRFSAFAEDPHPVRLLGSARELARSAWALLDRDLRVALVVKEIRADGSFSHVILNRLVGA
jgi:IMP cyclohydrolase